MKPYILLMGKWDTLSEAGSVPALIAIADPDNYKNVVSIYDILKGDSTGTNNRISEVLYNLGIKFTVKRYPAKLGTQEYHGFSVIPSYREDVNDFAFKEATVDYDIWEFIDEAGDIPQSAKDAISTVLKNNGISYNDSELNSVVTRIAKDAYSVINNQGFEVTGMGATKQSYSLYCADMPINVVNIDIITPRDVKPTTMAYPDSEIPLAVPSFYELICTQLSAEASEKNALNSLIDLDGDSAPEETMQYETHNFTNDNFSYRDIYKPKFMQKARISEIVNNGTAEIPIINPELINIRSVTQFWEVCPARKIPEEAFGYKIDNSRYTVDDLIGHTDNNHLTLQDNERRYYAQLEHLLKIAIAIEQNAISDEAYELVKDKMSETVENYCKTLAEQAFNLNWCHTGTTQAVYPESFSTEDDDDDDLSESVVSKYRLHCHYGTVEKDSSGVYKFVSTVSGFAEGAESSAISASLRKNLPRLYLGFDGDAEDSYVHHDGALVGYVNSSSNNHRWIDALIRLLRWGTRKPSMLTTEDIKTGANRPEKYWDLNSASASSNDGCIENLVPEVDEETGNEYKLVSVITTDLHVPGNMLDMYYPGLKEKIGATGIVHVPVGVILEVKMQGTDTYLNYCEDIFTYADKVKKGEKRGSLIYDNGHFKCFNGSESVLLSEVKLSDILQYIELETVNETVMAPDDNGNEVPVSMFIKFITTSNSQIISTRNDIAINCGDTKKYMAAANNKNLLTAIAEFAGIAIKPNMLAVGKEITKNKKLPNSMVICNIEHARITYMFLDKILRMMYSPTVVNDVPMFDIVAALNTLEDYNKEASNSTTGTVDIFNEYLAEIKKNPDMYIFLRFKKTDGYHSAVLGTSRDKASRVVIFTSLNDIERLKNELGADASKIHVHDKILGENHKKYFKNAIKIYNKSGKKLSSALYNLKTGSALFSSETAMNIIYKSFND